MSVLCCVLLYDFVHCLLLRRNNKYIAVVCRQTVGVLAKTLRGAGPPSAKWGGAIISSRWKNWEGVDKK